MNCIYLGLLSVFALCLTQSCSLRLSVWLLIYAVRTATFAPPTMRCVVRRLRTAAAKSGFHDVPGFSAAQPNGFRFRFRPRDDSRRLAHARRRSHGATRADLPQSERALKVLCEPHCAPSNVNAQLEECPVLLIISFGIRRYAYQGEKHQSQSPALTGGAITAARNPGVLKAA